MTDRQKLNICVKALRLISRMNVKATKNRNGRTAPAVKTAELMKSVAYKSLYDLGEL